MTVGLLILTQPNPNERKAETLWKLGRRSILASLRGMGNYIASHVQHALPSVTKRVRSFRETHLLEPQGWINTGIRSHTRGQLKDTMRWRAHEQAHPYKERWIPPFGRWTPQIGQSWSNFSTPFTMFSKAKTPLPLYLVCWISKSRTALISRDWQATNLIRLAEGIY